MLDELSTNKSLSEASAALHVAAQAHRSGIVHVHTLKETMAKKGVEFPGEWTRVDSPNSERRIVLGAPVSLL
jgi:hypothetical protein